MAAYDAFISYSHAKDKGVAATLQSAIQKLGKPWYRRRALRLFRDDSSLSATPHLWPSIEKALAASRFLILLASPQAAASPWVGKEVSWWLDRKGIDSLLIAVTEGELAWDEAAGDFIQGEAGAILPPVLAGRFGTEPKWVDIRAHRDGADPRNADFTNLAADFAATIHGLPKEDLLSQEVRQQRRALTLAWSAVGTLAILIVLAGWQWFEAEHAKQGALAAERLATEQKEIAQKQRDRAERNLNIAKRAADDVVLDIAHDLRDVTGMRVEAVRKILDVARTMMDRIANAEPDDPDLQRHRAVMLGEFAQTFQAAGDTARALSTVEEEVAIWRKVLAAEPDNARWQRALGISLILAGGMREAVGNRVGALAAFEESLAINRKHAAADPKNVDARRNITSNLTNIAEVNLDAGDRTAALSGYEESLAISRELAATYPDNATIQRDVVVVLNRIGEIQHVAGNRHAALVAFQESRTILRKLATADPTNAVLQRSLAFVASLMGDALDEPGGDTMLPLVFFEDSLVIRRKLAASDPGNAEMRGDVAFALSRVGNVELRAGHRDKATGAFEEGAAILRKLADADPDNALLKFNLHISLALIGDLRRGDGDRDRAMDAYFESLSVIRALVGIDPGNVGYQHDLSAALDNIGAMELEIGYRRGAAESYEESVAITRKLATDDPGNVKWQVELAISLYHLGTASAAPAARPAFTEALTVMDALAREGKLPPVREPLPQLVRDALAKLPPEADAAALKPASR